VIFKFVVDAVGKVTGFNTIQSGGSLFDQDVQRVISRMPVWKPGVQNGRKVSVYYMLPVSFIIPLSY
jgi:protein TonB